MRSFHSYAEVAYDLRRKFGELITTELVVAPELYQHQLQQTLEMIMILEDGLDALVVFQKWLQEPSQDLEEFLTLWFIDVDEPLLWSMFREIKYTRESHIYLNH